MCSCHFQFYNPAIGLAVAVIIMSGKLARFLHLQLQYICNWILHDLASAFAQISSLQNLGHYCRGGVAL
jgi:hypothetical protein